MGDPIEHGFKLLPADVHRRIQKTVNYSMQKTLVAAVSSLKTKKVLRNRNRRYQMLGSGVGAVGGYFGLPALLLELPVSTALMMRSIAEEIKQPSLSSLIGGGLTWVRERIVFSAFCSVR